MVYGQFTEGPSGYIGKERLMPNGDRKLAESLNRYSPSTILKVHRVFGKFYTRYDKDKIFK